MALSPNISISDASPYVRYTATDDQTTFTYPWPIFAASDLKVYVGTTLQTEGAEHHYTVVDVGEEAGGTIVFNTGLDTGDVVTIARDMPVARTTDFQTGSAIRARVLNEEFDKLVAVMQQLERDITRSFRLPITDNLSLGSREVTPVSGEFLKWGAQGNIASVATDPSGTVGDASAVSVTDTNGFLSAGNVEAAFTEVLGTGITPAASRTVTSLETYLGNNAMFNVVDYGAVGNGTANDTTAVQNALTAVPSAGGTVYFPAGTYKTTATLTIKSNTVVAGEGVSSIIKLTGLEDGNTAVLSVAGNSDITIRDLQIEGGMGTTASAYTNDFALNEGIEGTAGCTRILIDGVRVREMGGAGILFLTTGTTASSFIKVHNCVVDYTGTVGIQGQSGPEVSDTVGVSNMTVEDCEVSNFGLGYVNRPGIVVGRYASYQRVTGNYVKSASVGDVYTGSTSTHGISIDNAEHAVVANNIVEGTVGFGIEIGGTRWATVTGNVIKDTTSRAGISIGGSTYDCDSVTVVGNTIENSGGHGIYVNNVPDAALQLNLAIVGNVIKSAAGNGIYVDEASGVTIGSNVVAGSTLSGVYINDSDYMTITGNRILGSNTGDSTSHAGLRIVNAVTETHFTIADNQITGSGTYDTDGIVTDTNIDERISVLENTGTPSVSGGGSGFVTGGTTTITGFLNGVYGQVIHILAAGSVTVMGVALVANDTISFICDNDGLTEETWREVSRNVAGQTYAATNVSADRAYDADSSGTDDARLDELGDVLGTLIADLRTQGIVK